MNRRVSTKTLFSVSEEIDLPAMTGVFKVKVSASGNDSGCHQEIKYRSYGLKRVRVKVLSEAQGGATYALVPPSDSLLAGSTRWVHVGETRSGSARWVETQASLASPDATSRIEVTVEVRGDRPHSGKVRSGTSYLPLG